LINSGGSGRILRFDIDSTGPTIFGSGNVSSNLKFGTGTTEHVRITSTGNVGIGTTAPDRRLEINSPTGSNLRLTFNDSDGGATNYADFLTTSSGNLTISPSGTIMNIANVAGTSGIQFLPSVSTIQDFDGSPGDNGRLALGSGQLLLGAGGGGIPYGIRLQDHGIGTTPRYVNNIFEIVDGAGNVQIGFRSIGTTVFNEQGNDADFRIEGDTNPNLFFVDASADSIGIGTNTPASLFSVGSTSQFQVNSAGAIVAATGLSTSGTVAFTSIVNCGSGLQTDAGGVVFCLPSDQNTKENISTLSSALSKVTNLRGVSYNWKDKNRYGSQVEYGLIAQEVEAVAPELVFVMGNGTKGVKYQQLTGLLIEAIKEQNTKVDSIDQRLSQLEQSFASQGLQIQENGSEESVNNFFTDEGNVISTSKSIKTLGSIISSSISGIDGQNFVIKVAQNKAFEIVDTNNLSLFSVNANGKITLREGVGSSVGSVTLQAGETSIVISNPSVTNNSKILVTPNRPVAYGVTNKIAGASFTITINEPVVDSSISFDYFIVN